jgi:hypothetical protein
MRFPSRIPTILGIFLVVALIGGVGFLFERASRAGTIASGSVTPVQIEITNVTDNGFTVTWLTEAPATGVVSVESPSAKQTLFDERDATGKLGKYLTHSAVMRAAQADTTYELTLLSNGKVFLDNGAPFQIRTPQALPSPGPAFEPAFGVVLTEANLPAEGALVYYTLVGGQILSTLVKPSGSWLIPLNLVRASDLFSFLPFVERTDADIIVRANGAETIATTDTLNDNPVPDMTLGKTYDFRKQQASAPRPVAVAPASVLGQTTQAQSGVFAITSPQMNATLTSNLPLFSGTGVPGKSVSLAIGITNPVGGSAIVGTDGIWRFTPTARLTPGKQSVTATSVGQNGQAVAITHLFEVLKSGTQVLGEATPSAAGTLTPTPIPGSTESATLAGEPIPTSGNSLPLISLTILGLTLFATGGVLMTAREPRA